MELHYQVIYLKCLFSMDNTTLAINSTARVSWPIRQSLLVLTYLVCTLKVILFSLSQIRCQCSHCHTACHLPACSPGSLSNSVCNPSELLCLSSSNPEMSQSLIPVLCTAMNKSLLSPHNCPGPLFSVLEFNNVEPLLHISISSAPQPTKRPLNLMLNFSVCRKLFENNYDLTFKSCIGTG